MRRWPLVAPEPWFISEDCSLEYDLMCPGTYPPTHLDPFCLHGRKHRHPGFYSSGWAEGIANWQLPRSEPQRYLGDPYPSSDSWTLPPTRGWVLLSQIIYGKGSKQIKEVSISKLALPLPGRAEKRSHRKSSQNIKRQMLSLIRSPFSDHSTVSFSLCTNKDSFH